MFLLSKPLECIIVDGSVIWMKRSSLHVHYYEPGLLLFVFSCANLHIINKDRDI